VATAVSGLMDAKVAPLAAKVHQSIGLLLEDASQEFRGIMLGLGRRVSLPGRADMLAGKRYSPHAYAAQFLYSMRQAGLPRAAAERWLLWCESLVARLWGDDQTPYTVLEAREQDAENLCNQLHIRALRENTPENRLALYNARLAEAAAERACLAHPEAK